jgi:hypothetical protein
MQADVGNDSSMIIELPDKGLLEQAKPRRACALRWRTGRG